MRIDSSFQDDNITYQYRKDLSSSSINLIEKMIENCLKEKNKTASAELIKLII
jgi:hypothetical protein